MSKKETIKLLILRYAGAQSHCIWEASGSIDKDIKLLREEVKDFCDELGVEFSKDIQEAIGDIASDND